MGRGHWAAALALLMGMAVSISLTDGPRPATPLAPAGLAPDQGNELEIRSDSVFDFDATATLAAVGKNSLIVEDWHDLGYPGIEGYAVPRTVAPGGTVDLHVSSKIGDFQIEVWRQGAAPTLAHTSPVVDGVDHAIPVDAYAAGAGWPSSYQLAIPAGWASGIYLAKLVPVGVEIMDWYIPFVVRSGDPGATSNVLVVAPTATWQAYNAWGGKSLYGSASVPTPSGPHGTPIVSFERPYGDAGVKSYWRQGTGGYVGYGLPPLIEVLENAGITLEYADSIDLEDPAFVNAYDVIITAGHDEYFSKEMFDNVEEHRDRGGSLAWFAGNDVWWAVRFEDGGSTMVGYKGKCADDPYWDVDPTRVTCMWQGPELNRPNAALTAVDLVRKSGHGEPAPYVVVEPTHWVFDGLGFVGGELLGTTMVGGETEVRTPDAPPNVKVLMQAELVDRFGEETTYPAEATYYETTPEYGFPPGPVGRVFSGSSTFFFRGIEEDTRVGDIVVNIVSGFAASPKDGDMDGVRDRDDVCPGTSLPELAVPSSGSLIGYRYAEMTGDAVFESGNPDATVVTLHDTAGCSAEQIIAELDLPIVHTRYGLSRSAMKAWTDSLS